MICVGIVGCVGVGVGVGYVIVISSSVDTAWYGVSSALKLS